MVDDAELIEVSDFRGMQTLDPWLAGHDHGLLLAGPEPDGPDPLIHGVVERQSPHAGALLRRREVVTVWVRDLPTGGVREPRRQPPPPLPLASAPRSPSIADD